MIAFRRALVAGMATLTLAAACTSISVPTIPPIPSFPGFTIPPIVLPSGGGSTSVGSEQRRMRPDLGGRGELDHGRRSHRDRQ